MYKQIDEQTLIDLLTKLTLGEQLGILHKFTHLKSIENKHIHRLWSVYWRFTLSLPFPSLSCKREKTTCT